MFVDIPPVRSILLLTWNQTITLCLVFIFYILHIIKYSKWYRLSYLWSSLMSCRSESSKWSFEFDKQQLDTDHLPTVLITLLGNISLVRPYTVSSLSRDNSNFRMISKYFVTDRQVTDKMQKHVTRTLFERFERFNIFQTRTCHADWVLNIKIIKQFSFMSWGFLDLWGKNMISLHNCSPGWITGRSVAPAPRIYHRRSPLRLI